MNSEQPQQPERKGGCCLGGIGLTLGIPLLIIGGIILAEFLLTAIGGILVIADPLEPAAAVAVLSGGGLPRLEEAAKIYKEEYVKFYILTETGAKLQGYDVQYITYLKMQVINMGIPSGAIKVTDEHAYNTLEEARAVLDLLKREGFDSCIIVTDPFHTLRTRLIFRDVFKDSGIKVSVRPVRGHWYRSTTWWTRLEGWQVTFQEYVRLFAYLSGVQS